jgi:hypothetical protein
MGTLRSYVTAAVLTGGMALLSSAAATAQQPAASCAWNKYLYAQDAVQQGKIDTNLLNQMSSLVSAQGYSLTNKVWQVCNGWLMDAKRANGSLALLYVEPKTQTIIDVDFTK